MEVWIGLGWLTLTAGVIAGIAVIVDWLQDGRKLGEVQQMEWEMTAARAEDWARTALGQSQRVREELLGMEERIEETRYLLAEVSTQVAAAGRMLCPPGMEPAPRLQAVYNSLDRLAEEATRIYEAERPGTPRQIPFPPPVIGGSE
jgi:hypothetical protein